MDTRTELERDDDQRAEQERAETRESYERWEAKRGERMEGLLSRAVDALESLAKRG